MKKALVSMFALSFTMAVAATAFADVSNAKGGFAYDPGTSWPPHPETLSAWRRNPDGSFTEIPTAPSFPDLWEPARISESGKTVVGMIGNPWWGSIAAFWNEGTGTQDPRSSSSSRDSTSCTSGSSVRSTT